MGNPVYPEPVFQEAPPVHIAADGTRTEGWVEAKAARDAEMLSLGRVAANVEHNADNRPSPYVRFQDRLDQGQDTDRFGLLDIFNPLINLYNLANTVWDQVQFKELYKSFDRNVTSTDDVQELSLGVIDHLGDSLDDMVEFVDFLKEATDQAKLYFMTLGKEGSLEPFALLIKGILSQIRDLIAMWFDKQLPDSVAEDIIATFNAIALATSPRELGRGLGKFIQYIIEKIGPGRIKAMVAKAGKKLPLKKGIKENDKSNQNSEKKKDGNKENDKKKNEQLKLSPNINPKDIAGKKPKEIDSLARDMGLEAKGRDPMNGLGLYIDPVTGNQRILIHPTPRYGSPHVHINNANGQRLDIKGRIVDQESPAAHLPLDLTPE